MPNCSSSNVRAGKVLSRLVEMAERTLQCQHSTKMWLWEGSLLAEDFTWGQHP